MAKTVQLIIPHTKYQQSYVDALREGLHLTQATAEDIALAEQDLDAYFKKRFDLSTPVTLPDGRQMTRVPQTDLWLVDGEKFLGISSVRHQLNDFLMQRGGHIGYAIRATERKKGYGKLILKLTLAYVKSTLGLEKALVTCHDQNIGSIRIIENNGGILQDTVPIAGLAIPERRYWIKI